MDIKLCNLCNKPFQMVVRWVLVFSLFALSACGASTSTAVDNKISSNNPPTQTSDAQKCAESSAEFYRG